MAPRRQPVAPVAAELLEEALRAFLTACAAPVLQEPGEERIALAPGRYAFERSAGRLLLSAWDETRTWSRRVAAAEAPRTGRLHLVIERFGGRQGEAWIYDAGRPESPAWDRHGGRMVFRERLRRMLQRSFRGWEIVRLTTERDLEHTFSANYPRGFVRQGERGWAVIGAAAESDRVLTFGLIWLAYLRRREPRTAIEGLAIFLPAAEARATAFRVRWLDGERARCRIYGIREDGFAEPLEPGDWGNLDTAIEPCRHSVDGWPEWVREVAGEPGVEVVRLAGGAASLRVEGLEFARWREGELRGGLDEKRTMTAADAPELRRLAAMLGGLRESAGGVLHRRAPEAWLESRVRASLPLIDARLRTEPVYGQVPAMAGVERGVADLLAVEPGGRLAVIEVKASEDPHLPLQALDYWMRVAWHAARDEFRTFGYFPGLPVAQDPPRLLLVAPALEFHPTTETILGFFSSEIAVERIGVGVEWRQRLKPVFRLRGAAAPA